MADWSWQLDGWIIAAGVLCAVSASLLGNFLVLRQMSMLGDAITHAILPGLAVAFLISESRSSVPMFLGAVIVGVLTALFTEWIRRFGRVDEGASMGVVFTSLFALGLVLIVQAADYVDLDASCVLYGSIEYTPLDTTELFGVRIPRAVLVLSITAIINALFVIGLFKELKLTSFDPALATTTGFSSSAMHYALMVLVAITSVAAFESVGNILVVAMFIVPPAAAYLLTDRLERMIVLSVVLAVLAAIVGHIAAIEVPRWFGFRSTTTAGMMATVAGLILLLAVSFSPKHGLVSRYVRRLLLARRILSDDIVALLYRCEENGTQDQLTIQRIAKLLLASQWTLGFATRKLVR
ncbi:MAG: metal ABC transporter permease, partial [Planctomycetota bacterium]